MSRIKEKLNKLPKVPGVYIFKDVSNKILYVGKATNLRSRVGSYFQGRDERGARIASMVAQIADIKIQKTDSVLEALILEANLIKKFQPKYNVERKDDKSFSYVAITKEEFPRVIILRETEISESQKSNVKSQNDNSKLKNSELIQNSKFQIQNSNIYGPYTSKKQLEIALKIIRKIFPYHSNKQKTEKGCLDFQLGRCSGPYVGAISKEDYAKNIRGIKMILEGKKRYLIKNLEQEMKNLAKKNEFEEAAELRNKIFALKHIQDVALISGDKEILNTKYRIPNTRIEAYDISNISGQHAVGSMIVFENRKPNKNEYRKFKIKTIEGSNDVGMMAEILFRRFRHLEWRKPELILLDGGIGHVNMGSKVLQELGLDIPIVGVAKGSSRKISNVKFLTLPIGRRVSNKIPTTQFLKKILKDKNLIKRIMDEAHRFAIGYHRKLRKNNFLK